MVPVVEPQGPHPCLATGTVAADQWGARKAFDPLSIQPPGQQPDQALADRSTLKRWRNCHGVDEPLRFPFLWDPKEREAECVATEHGPDPCLDQTPSAGMGKIVLAAVPTVEGQVVQRNEFIPRHR